MVKDDDGSGVVTGMKEAPPKYYPYPPPLAKYEEVSANKTIFMATLEKLHASMSTKFMIPIIGGKELDLHRLFVEVTSRGGIDQVLNEKRWREITAVFHFPSTATNASFVLRKYYFSLLHHYEQIYYFRAKGWTSPAEPFASPSPTPISAKGVVERVHPSPEGHVTVAHKRSKVAMSPSVNCPVPVSGFIDGKFEHGYFLTVMAGTETLRGVVYHISEQPTTSVPPYSSKDDTASGPHRRRRRKKSELKRRDPAHPKPNRSGYNFFFAEQHARLKPLHPGKDREISKMIGELWNKLNETEKSVYQDKGLKDKERYKSEMELYREKLNTGLIINDAVPIQQRLAASEVVKDEENEKLHSEEAETGGDEKVEAEEDEAVMVEGDDNEVVDGGSSGACDSDDEKTTVDKASEMEISVGSGNGAESGKVEVVAVVVENENLQVLESDVEMVEVEEKVEAKEVDGNSLDETDLDDDKTTVGGKDLVMEMSVASGCNGVESGNVEAEDTKEVMVNSDEKLDVNKIARKDIEMDASVGGVKNDESNKVVDDFGAEGEKDQTGEKIDVSSVGNVADSINKEELVSNDGN